MPALMPSMAEVMSLGDPQDAVEQIFSLARSQGALVGENLLHEWVSAQPHVAVRAMHALAHDGLPGDDPVDFVREAWIASRALAMWGLWRERHPRVPVDFVVG